MRLFNPIMNVYRKLNDVQKFSFVGIILGVPIIVLTLIVLSILTDEIHSMEERLHGIHNENLLKDLLRNVQLHRLYTYLEQEDVTYQQESVELRAEIHESIKEINEYNIKTKSDLITEDQALKLQQKWTDIEKLIDKHPNYTKSMHDVYILSIIDLMEMIAGKSKLILANDEFMYYLTYDVTKTLPNLLEHLGQIRIIGTGVKTELTERDRRQIIYHLSGVENYTTDLKYSHYMKMKQRKSFESYNLDETDDIFSTIHDFTAYVEHNFLDEPDDIEQFTKEATRTIEATFDYYTLKTNHLETLIQHQLTRQKSITACVMAFQLIAFLLTLYCLFGFYFSIRNTLKEIRIERKNVREKYVQTQEKLKQMTKTMAQKVMQAHEEERKSIARDLHDSIGQSLYSIIVKLKLAEHQTGKELKNNLANISNIAEHSLKEMKRISQTLRPEILDDLGFVPALKSYLEDYKKTYNIEVNFEFIGDKVRLQPEIETQLFRICQEALTNVAKHAQASSIQISRFTSVRKKCC